MYGNLTLNAHGHGRGLSDYTFLSRVGKKSAFIRKVRPPALTVFYRLLALLLI